MTGLSSSEANSTVLVVATESNEKLDASCVPAGAGNVLFADLSESAIETHIPASWNRIDISAFFDADQFRTDFFAFFEEWPKRKLFGGRSFDEVFRLPSGYSVWWTMVGSKRTPGYSPVPELQKLWTLNRILQSFTPDSVILKCDNDALRAAIETRCRRPDSVGASDGANFGMVWLLRNFMRLAIRPIKAVGLAILVKLQGGRPKETRERRNEPAALFCPKVSRDVVLQGGKPTIPLWDAVCNELSQRIPGIRHRFSLNPDVQGDKRKLLHWLKTTGAEVLPQLNRAAPLFDAYSGIGAWLKALPTQLVALFRFSRNAGSVEIRDSFDFGGFKTQQIFLPKVAAAVANIAEWERRVGTVKSTIKTLGNVKVFFSSGEFYPRHLPILAACEQLDVVSVGVQHGTLFPAHLVYTVPHGHVTQAPTPDYFGVYGPYAKHVVSGIGAFPAERVWEIGAPRLDHLVNQPPKKSRLRQELGLPADRPVVLVATQTFPWFPEVVRSVLTSLATTDCVVCIKAHFGDRARLDRYREMASGLRMNHVRFYEDDFQRLLGACDVLISSSSTALLEATLIGRDTICANFANEPDRFPYASEGGSHPAKNADEMQQCLTKLLPAVTCADNTKRDLFLHRHLGATASGSGAMVLAELVLAHCIGGDKHHFGEPDVPDYSNTCRQLTEITN